MPKQQRATIVLTTTPELSRQQRDDFMRLHVGKSAFDVMLEQQAMRLKEWHNQQYWFLSDSLIPKSEFKATAPLKQSAELLAEIFNTRTALYELARRFAALSLHALRKQNNINDRVVIAMTEKFTLVQLSSEKISYRHDAPHKPAH